jgi:ketosteroid isomerase-like protein
VVGERKGDDMLGAVLLQRWTKKNFNRLVAQKDVEAVMRGWSENGVFELPGTSALSGRFEGRREIEAWLRKWFDSIATIEFSVKRVAVTNPLAIGFTNDVMIEWEVREATHRGASVTARGITVWELRGGKLIAARDYFFDPSVLAALHGPRLAADPSLRTEA